MISQSSWRKGSLLRKFVLGPHPLIEHFLEKLRIRELIATYIPQDQRIKLPIERTLGLLIHNILTTPMPMYEIADWLAPLDEHCLGLEPEEVACVHDDRVGHALESFYGGRNKDVFFHLALRAIKTFELQCNHLHQDTTTVTFTGKYADWQAAEALTHGHNKDHRPDLKQLVLGLSVTADGSVPLVHQVYSGNQTDDRLHLENHQRLRRLLQRSDFVYVADSKLATKENLNRLASFGGYFISVMPRTRKEDADFRQRVRNKQVEWIHLLSRPNNRQPKSKTDHYYLAQGQYEVDGYRLLWIRSTQKAEQDAQSRSRRIANTLDGLRHLQARLNAYNLKTRPAIEKTLEDLIQEQDTQDWIDYKIEEHRQSQIRFTKPGRPKNSHKGREVWKSYFSVSFQVDRQALEQDALVDGIFPLLTNLEASPYDPKRVLETYKCQAFLEKRHSQLKTWQEVTPVLLKKDVRVVAYLHMQVMALMVATLIERQLRKAMVQHSLRSLPLYPEDRPCRYPTMFDIVRVFRQVERYEVQEGEKVTLFPAKLTPLQRQLLGLLEVPASLYQ
jgi:transposase